MIYFVLFCLLVPGFPKVQCDIVKCADPYFGYNLIPNAPPNTSLPAQDPFGSGGPSFVQQGLCPVDKTWNDNNEVIKLAFAQLHAFDVDTHGFFFWNFRTELETRWDYFRVSAY